MIGFARSSGTTINGQRAFAFAISESVFRPSQLRRVLVQASLAGWFCLRAYGKRRAAALKSRPRLHECLNYGR
jgi:hypothetical protein